MSEQYFIIGPRGEAEHDNAGDVITYPSYAAAQEHCGPHSTVAAYVDGDLLARLVDAEADGAAMREKLKEELKPMVCPDCGGSGHGDYDRYAPSDTRCVRCHGKKKVQKAGAALANRLLKANYPGADLLARLAELEAKLAGAMALLSECPQWMGKQTPNKHAENLCDDLLIRISAALASMPQEKA